MKPAILAVEEPAPLYNTFPMQISSTIALLKLVPAYYATASRTGLSIASGPVSFYGPFLALVIAVLAIPIITISSSRLGASFLPLLKLEPLLDLNYLFRSLRANNTKLKLTIPTILYYVRTC